MDLGKVSSDATQMNNKEIYFILGVLSNFEDLFDDTIGKWYRETVDLKTT